MSEELWDYAEVRKFFGWKSNRSIRLAVEKGQLVRERVSARRNGWKITAASCRERMAGLQNALGAMQEFDIKPAQWASWKQAKAHEDDAKKQPTVDPALIAKNTFTIGDLGEFYTNPEASADPLTGQMTPAGCYRDETDTLVFGLPSPRESQHAFRERCKRRGIRPAKSLYIACLMDGSGKFRVNDVPVEQQSKPPLMFTPAMGTKGGV